VKRSHTPTSLYATSNIPMGGTLYHQQAVNGFTANGVNKHMSLNKKGELVFNRATPMSFRGSSDEAADDDDDDDDNMDDNDVLTARIGGGSTYGGTSTAGRGLGGGGFGPAKARIANKQGPPPGYNIPPGMAMMGSNFRPKSRAAAGQVGLDYSQY
jgi:hypothetical protein